MLIPNELTITALGLTAAPVVARAILWLNQKRREHEKEIVEATRREMERSLAERSNRRFVHSMATNHLPHLFNSDKKLAEGLNMLLVKNGIEHRVEIDDAPPIDFIPYDPGRER
jgi:uncharacterized 2Fe-2S/4Fe-4S cluster protein (DUF4445 family)